MTGIKQNHMNITYIFDVTSKGDTAMTTTTAFLTTLVFIGLLATFAALWWGLSSMVFGGAYDRKHAPQFMSARVALQALTLLLVGIALWLSLA